MKLRYFAIYICYPCIWKLNGFTICNIKRKNMRTKLMSSAAVLAFVAIASTSSALAFGPIPRMVVTPLVSTLSMSNGPQSVKVAAFCSSSPCTIIWQPIKSNSDVGTVYLSGPVATFTVGTKAGTVILMVTDGKGDQSSALINVTP